MVAPGQRHVVRRAPRLRGSGRDSPSGLRSRPLRRARRALRRHGHRRRPAGSQPRHSSRPCAVQGCEHGGHRPAPMSIRRRASGDLGRGSFVVLRQLELRWSRLRLAGMPDDERPPISLADPSVIRALSHPARVVVIDELFSGRVATSTQLAALAGLSPSAMSYHLRSMAKLGVVERDESGTDGRERPWRACGSGITLTRADVARSTGRGGDAGVHGHAGAAPGVRAVRTRPSRSCRASGRVPPA